MYKLYLPMMLTAILFSCSTRVQYVGNSYSPSKHLDVYVTESSVSKPYTIIGRGHIQDGYRGTNWNKVRKDAIRKGKSYGADAVLITQHNAVSPIPALSTRSTIDSMGKTVVTKSNTQTYFPVSWWHEILFIKYQ